MKHRAALAAKKRGARSGRVGQPLGEGPPRTSWIAAVHAPHRQLQADLAVEARQICRASHSAAVDSMARLATARTANATLPGLRSNPNVVRIRARDLPDPASWEGIKVLYPGYYRPAGRTAASRSGLGSSTTLSAEEPWKRGRIRTGYHNSPSSELRPGARSPGRTCITAYLSSSSAFRSR